MLSSRRIATMGGDIFRDEYSLAFDGTNDYLATGADGTAADATYVFWAKSSVTGANKGVFGHGGDRVGAFHFNHSSGRPILYLTDSDRYQYWVDTPAQDDGQWHHWAVVVDIDDMENGCKLYVDGILIAQYSRDESGTTTAYGNLEIGRSTTANEFQGNISDFAVYNTLLTQAQIQTIYNGREPFNHKESSFASNLTNWWRMGDGALDEYQATTTSGIIQDVVNEGFGNDVITNGGFDADSDWIKGDFTIGSGVATVTTDGANQYLKQTNLWSDNANDGKVVKLEYEITANTDTIALKINGFSGTDISSGSKTLASTVGVHQAYLFVNGTGNADSITFYINHTTGETISIDNVKLSVSNGAAGSMTNMALADIETDTP